MITVVIDNISATATKVDPYMITLNAAITTKDLLVLSYVATTECPLPV